MNAKVANLPLTELIVDDLIHLLPCVPVMLERGLCEA